MPRKKIKLIRQKHRLGCGIACLAMIAGISYNESLALLHPNREKGEITSVDTDQLVSAIRDLGYHCSIYWGNFPLNLFSSRMIIGVLHPKSRPKSPYCESHVVVWDPKVNRIYDPYRSRALPKEKYQKEIGYAIFVG